MVLGCADLMWNEYLNRMPLDKQDVYYTSQYYRMGEMSQQGKGQMFVYEADNNLGLYPFIKRDIVSDKLEGQYCDIETVYGYGGPIIQKDSIEFGKKFEDAFLEYCRQEHIVAEFVRFHPLLHNESIFRQHIEVLHNRNTVWLNLEHSIDDIWMKEISTQNRNVIRKCQKNGLYVEVGTDYSEFVDIYNETMNKVGAEDFYFFDREYYRQLGADKNTVLLYVKQEERVLAAAIFMGYGEYFHYHLSGSRKEFLKLSPNNILLWEAIRYAKEKGYKKMHFGGGLTDSMEDNLFRFKQKFSSEHADFYIGKRVHDEQTYRILIDDWEARNNRKAGILLQYRE